MLALLLVACVPDPVPVTEIGNPERGLGIAAVPLPDSAPASRVDRAWGALGEIKLVLDERYAGGDELEWETPEVVAELTAGPVEVAFRSPDAAYNRVVVRPRKGRDLPGAPPEGEDASFVAEGIRADGVPFVLWTENEDDLELVGGFDLDDQQRELALGFDVDAWLTDAELDAATVDQGVVRIDPGHNTDLLAAFERRLADSLVLVEDTDDDGQADPDVDLVLLD